MRGIHLQFSNRFECLADRLIEALGRANARVLSGPTVLVPSTAIRRRLTLEAARRHGVCANVHFDYLASWLWKQVVAHRGSARLQSPFEVDPLSWRVYAALSDAAWTAPHDRLARYVSRAEPTQRYGLARRIAQVLHHYTTYRTDWLEAWQEGAGSIPRAPPGAAEDDARWLAALWRRITTDLGVQGANPLSTWARDLADPAIASIPGLPEEIHVFALPAIAPLHLQALQALSRRIRVSVYAPNPCREYWFDLVDPRRLAQLQALGRADHHETGHRLLAAWGKQTQSQLQLLLECLESPTETTCFVVPEGTSLLATLQRSILTLEEPAAGSLVLADDDRSLEIHACHSLTRELEVLHDRLLALFRDAPQLSPADVLVAVPDLETATPRIDAVFGSVPASRRIPYAITGLSARRSNEIAGVLLALLELARSRWNASEVHALLSKPLVAARFGLDADDLERIRAWFVDSGIRWGADGAHRAALGLPQTDAHSAADGLDRLFLGYALPGASQSPFEGRLPAGDARGIEARALGALWGFLESLRALQQALSQERTAAQWANTIESALHGFIAQDAGEPEEPLQVLQAVRRVTGAMQDGLGTAPLPFELALVALKQSFDAHPSRGVPTGAVTFASMHDLRGVPFEVVCVLGLNDRAFPTTDRPAEFDLMAAFPRQGDRQRRLDDRNTFMDLLLAARRTVHLSYQGRDLRDNAVSPPSVVVAELLDWAVAAIAADPPTARSRLVVEHPLQPFSRRCFDPTGTTDPRVRSFDADFALALSRRLARARVPRGAVAPIGGLTGEEPVAPGPVFFATPLPAPGPEWHEVTLERLVRFYRNPARHLLEQRVGLTIEDRIPALADDEPFLGDAAARKALSARLLRACIAGVDRPRLETLARAGIEAPRSPIGAAWLAGEIGRLQAFGARVAAHLAGPVLPPHTVRLPLSVDGSRWALHATFTTLRECGLVCWRDVPIHATDRLEAWLHHLMLSAAPAAGAAPSVTWIAPDATVGFRPVSAPGDTLAALVRLYARGLSEPLMFLPRSAWAFVEKEKDDWGAAATRWSGSEFGLGRVERDQPAVRIALRGLPDPIATKSPEFAARAREVYGPLIAHLEEH